MPFLAICSGCGSHSYRDAFIDFGTFEEWNDYYVRFKTVHTQRFLSPIDEDGFFEKPNYSFCVALLFPYDIINDPTAYSIDSSVMWPYLSVGLHNDVFSVFGSCPDISGADLSCLSLKIDEGDLPVEIITNDGVVAFGGIYRTELKRNELTEYFSAVLEVFENGLSYV